MRRRALLLASVLPLVLLAPNAARAAGPPTIEHFRDAGTDVDPDFCGSGASIDVSFDVRGTVWIAADDSLFKVTERGRVVFSNPDTGDAAVLSWAQQFTERFVGEEDGLTTILLTFKGLPEKIQTANGPVLLRDAGYITFQITFDEQGEEVAFDVVVNKGPHPEADSEGALFCEVLVPALGLA